MTTRAERDDSLRAAINALPASRRNGRAEAILATTDFLPGTMGIVIEAAKGRRLSVAAYLRRAALAMACHDLQIPLSEALTRDPRVTRETGYAVEDPDGVRFGAWEIERLVGEGVSDDGSASADH